MPLKKKVPGHDDSDSNDENDYDPNNRRSFLYVLRIGFDVLDEK